MKLMSRLKLLYAKCLEKCLAHSRHSISLSYYYTNYTADSSEYPVSWLLLSLIPNEDAETKGCALPKTTQLALKTKGSV